MGPTAIQINIWATPRGPSAVTSRTVRVAVVTAHIRLEAALETSERWQITDASLLRWRRKLKRAAQECDETMHKCKQRILEDEQMQQEVRISSLPTWIVHATKSFVSTVLYRNNNKQSRSMAQRFEWYADGTSEFLRFIELGGTHVVTCPFTPLSGTFLQARNFTIKSLGEMGILPFSYCWCPSALKCMEQRPIWYLSRMMVRLRVISTLV